MLDLEIGETLKTLEGTTVVESRVLRPEPEPVYNIEVHGDHCYRVGESGVLVHNASINEVLTEALQNCCGENEKGYPECQIVTDKVTNASHVRAAVNKKAQAVFNTFIKPAVPGIVLDSCTLIQAWKTGEGSPCPGGTGGLRYHCDVSKPGDGINPKHNISLECCFCCFEGELYIVCAKPHWGSRENKLSTELTYPGCPDKLY